MKTIEIEVQDREQTGKGPNRKLRREGIIPAVLYGASRKNFKLQLPVKSFSPLLKSDSENAIITLKSSVKEVSGKHVLLKDWDRDILTRKPIHADFYEIDLTKPVRIKVPLHFTGKAKGIENGGLISPVVREIEVDCLPSAIPDFVEVDVTALNIGDSIHIEDIKIPEGVTKHFTENFTVVTCTVVKEEVVAPTPVEGAAPTEPEVIAKGKKEEAEGGAAGAAPAKGGAAGGGKASESKK